MVLALAVAASIMMRIAATVNGAAWSGRLIFITLSLRMVVASLAYPKPGPASISLCLSILAGVTTQYNRIRVNSLKSST
jgi:hypothetical protein